MAASPYDKGDTVRLSAAFTNQSGTPVAPATVVALVRNPSHAVATHVYGGGLLTATGTGAFQLDVSLPWAVPHGRWDWRVESTGSHEAASEGFWFVRDSVFDG